MTKSFNLNESIFLIHAQAKINIRTDGIVPSRVHQKYHLYSALKNQEI